MLPEVVTNNKQLIEFSHGSSIKAIPTSEDAGRSEALSLLIVDEAAFVKNFDELWMGLYPTLSTGGRAILLSTPNGVGGQYYKLYTDAEAGMNEFTHIKLPWDVHPERGEEWFQKESKNFSKRQISQEFLCDFASSGETFINDDDLRWLHSMIRSPVDRIGFDKNVWVWSHPIGGKNYVMTADVARGDSKDFSTFHVIDISTGEIVAEYKGKIPPDRFGELLNEIGRKYNDALMCPENNSYGYATILRLKDLAYPKLYYSRRGIYVGDYVPSKDHDNAGFTTSGKSRNMILTKLEEMIRNKQILSYSSRFYDEIKTFVWKGNKAQAMKGYNDDLVLSLAIGSWIVDTSSDVARDSKSIASALIQGMSVKRNLYDNGDSPGQMKKSKPGNQPSSRKKSEWGAKAGSNGEFDWLLK